MRHKTSSLCVAVLLGAATTGCSAPCPDGYVYDGGEIVWIPIYDPALKMVRLQPTWPDRSCVEVDQ